MSMATSSKDQYWSPEHSKLFSSSSKQSSHILPPIRLNIQQVEKSLQDECLREIARKNQQQQPKPAPAPHTFNLETLFSTSANLGTLPLFPTTTTTASAITTDRSLPTLDRLCLKRFKRAPLFENSTKSIQQDESIPEIVFDIPSFSSSYQRFQQWKPLSPEADNNTAENRETQNNVEDILEEVLGETDYSSRNRIIALPTTNQRSVSPVATALLSAIQSAKDTTQDHGVPVFATPFQLQAVQKEVDRLGGNLSSSSSVKHRLGKVIDIFNHPMHAMIPGYSTKNEGEGATVFDGSGKTMFLHQLVSRLEERGQDFNLAMVCHDLNMEGFLLDLFKPKYSVTRLNMVIKGYWQKEYGIVLCIRRKQPMVQQSSFTNKVHLVISTDLRIQHDNQVMTMFENASDPTREPPVIVLMTVWSMEERLMAHTRKTAPLMPPGAFWVPPNQKSCQTIFDTSKDTPVEDRLKMTQGVVDSVIRWIESDTPQPFLLSPLHQNESVQSPFESQQSTPSEPQQSMPSEPQPEPMQLEPQQPEPQPEPMQPEPQPEPQPEHTQLEPQPEPTQEEPQPEPTQPEPQSAPMQPSGIQHVHILPETQQEPTLPEIQQQSTLPETQQEEQQPLEQEEDEEDLPLFVRPPKTKNTDARTPFDRNHPVFSTKAIRTDNPKAFSSRHYQQEDTMEIDIESIDANEPLPVNREDLTKLFSHVSIDQLSTNLKSYRSHHTKSSKEHFTTSSDEDSFYSAESETGDDLAASCVNEVMEKFSSNHLGTEVEEVAMANMLKSMKLQFDEKCLDYLSTLVDEYQTKVKQLQQEFVDEAGLILRAAQHE